MLDTLLAATPTVLPHAPASAGFAAGFLHPFMGADHLLAMAVIGWLAARLPGRQAWLPPSGFVLASLLGGLLAFRIPGLAWMEWGIAASVLLLGLAVMAAAWLKQRDLLLVATGLALTGIAHGYAHVNEANHAATEFFVGFMVATALLHGLGYLGGRSLARRWHWLGPLVGGGMSLFGLVLLVG